MSNYRVHLYACVRVSFDVEEASSHEDAARRVLADPATYEELCSLPGYADDFDSDLAVDELDGHRLVSSKNLSVSDRGEVTCD